MKMTNRSVASGSMARVPTQGTRASAGAALFKFGARVGKLMAAEDVQRLKHRLAGKKPKTVNSV